MHFNFLYSLFINCLKQYLVYFTCKYFSYCNWLFMCKDALNNGKGLVNGHLTFRVDITSGLVCVLWHSSLIDIRTNMLILSKITIRVWLIFPVCGLKLASNTGGSRIEEVLTRLFLVSTSHYILWYWYICEWKTYNCTTKGLVNIEYPLELGHINDSLYLDSLEV